MSGEDGFACYGVERGCLECGFFYNGFCFLLLLIIGMRKAM